MKRTLLFLAVIFSFTQTQAATRIWTGAVNGDFNFGPNWDDFIGPGAGDIALIGPDFMGNSPTTNNVTITASVTVQTLTVSSGADLTINAGVTLTIDGSNADDGFETTGTGNVIVNNGTIIITNTDGENGITSKGDFTNNGVITIDGVSGSSTNGFYIQDGFFTNSSSGSMTITNCADEYLRTDDNGGSIGVFTNDGTITITMTGGDEGLYLNDNSEFNNNGTVDINGAGGGDFGVRMENGSTLNNNSGGMLNITASSDDGFHVMAGTTLNNAGDILVTNAGIGAGSTNTSDHAILLDGTFNNMTGGTFKEIDSQSDGIRIRSGSTMINNGTLVFDGFAGDAIDNEGPAAAYTYGAGSTMDLGCPGVIAQVQLKWDHDLGPTCVNFDIQGTAGGANAGGHDELENYGSGGVPTTSLLDLTSATAKLNWGSFVPEVGDCFRIVTGSGLVSAPWGSIVSSNPNIVYTVDYEDDTSGDEDECEICVTQILPIELVHFSVKKSNKSSELLWETSTEINNEGFDVERSNDGLNWSKIGYVAGNGNSYRSIEYTYSDKSPKKGNNYYRLKQLDYDGNFDYSHVVSLNFNEITSAITFYPNPIKDVLYLNGMDEVEDIEAQLLDSNGKLLWSKKGKINQIPFADYKPGIYFLNIISSTEQIVKKVVRI